MCNDKVDMNCEHKGSVFTFLKRSLQESLLLEFVRIQIIFFLNSEYFNAACSAVDETLAYCFQNLYK